MGTFDEALSVSSCRAKRLRLRLPPPHIMDRDRLCLGAILPLDMRLVI